MSTQEQNTPLMLTMDLAIHIIDHPTGLDFLRSLKRYYSENTPTEAVNVSIDPDAVFHVLKALRERINKCNLSDDKQRLEMDMLLICCEHIQESMKSHNRFSQP